MYRIGDYRGINRLYKKMILQDIMTPDEAHEYRMNLLDNKIKAERAALETADLIIKNMVPNAN